MFHVETLNVKLENYHIYWTIGLFLLLHILVDFLSINFKFLSLLAKMTVFNPSQMQLLGRFQKFQMCRKIPFILFYPIRLEHFKAVCYFWLEDSCFQTHFLLFLEFLDITKIQRHFWFRLCDKNVTKLFFLLISILVLITLWKVSC